MRIWSPAFRPNSEIPQQYTCEGPDISPPLRFDTSGTEPKALALIVEDPDAPRGSFAHWVLYNLPPDTKELGEGVDSASLPEGTRVGINSFNHTGWSGPCPRAGKAKHRYVFTLYALDEPLPEVDAPPKDQLMRMMRGHILGQAQLVGMYEMQERRAAPPR